MRVLVSGAGIAGPSVAYWLHRCGHTPTLVESAPALRTGGYVVDFWGLGFRIAGLMGIEDAVRDAGYRSRWLRGVRPDGSTFARVSVAPFSASVAGRYTTIARSDLSALIVATIADDVEIIFGDRITAIHDDGRRLSASFECRPDREFDLVLGADGLHSGVRRLIFGRDDPEHYLGCAVAAFTATGYPHREEGSYVLYNLVGAQVARFTLRDDRTLFLVVARMPRDEVPGDDGAAKAMLRDRFGDAGWECREILARLDDADDFYLDAVSQIRLPRWSRGRVALVGDAAAAVSLLAGEGTGLAMVEAYVLAGELHRAGGEHRRALAAYQRRLRPFVRSKQDGAGKFISFFAATSPRALAVRNLGLRAATIRPLARVASSLAFRDNFTLPDYRM